MPISLPWWFLLINHGCNSTHGSVGFYESSLQGCGEAAARGRRLWGRGRVSRGQRRGRQRLAQHQARCVGATNPYMSPGGDPRGQQEMSELAALALLRGFSTSLISWGN